MCFSAIIKIIFLNIFLIWNLIYYFFEWTELWAEVGGIEWFKFSEFMEGILKEVLGILRGKGPSQMSPISSNPCISSRSTNCHQSTN
jgi:hypothetical protein